MLLSVGKPLRGLENVSFPFAPGNAARDVAGKSAPSAAANATSTNARPARGVAPKRDPIDIRGNGPRDLPYSQAGRIIPVNRTGHHGRRRTKRLRHEDPLDCEQGVRTGRNVSVRASVEHPHAVK